MACSGGLRYERGREGWEFELSTLVWRLRRTGCNMTRARGQSLRAKVTAPPANGVAAARRPLGVGNTPPQSPPSSAPASAQCPSADYSSPKGRSVSEEAECLQRKDQRRPTPRPPSFISYGFGLIIYPDSSAPGNFAPGRWARTRVRALPWDTGWRWSWAAGASAKRPAGALPRRGEALGP